MSSKEASHAEEGTQAETEVTIASAPDGVLIHDPIDRHQFELRTDVPVDPTPTSTDQFGAPVDVAVSIEATTLSYDNIFALYVRDEAGTLLAEAQDSIDRTFPAGTYIIDISPPIKLYLRVEGEMEIGTDSVQTTIDFGERAEIVIGARSHHENPAGTITTPSDPESMMRAISAMGSALKTTSPERSFPTLRGHPPLIEIGEELSIPSGLEPPETGVYVEVPPVLEYILEVAPLAYYLGATVREGSIPAITTDSGFEYQLDSQRGFSTAVEQTLKQVFLLDCVTRTEGIYKVDLHERHEIEPALDFDFGELYEMDLQGRLSEYLSVPYEIVEPHVPEWKLTTVLSPEPESLEVVPFALNELAIIRTQQTQDITTPVEQASAIDGFARQGELTRSASAESPSSLDTVVKPEATDSLGQAWVGDGAPVGATKGSVEAFKNRLARKPTTGDISISVVVNDPEMDEEREQVKEIYGSRENLPFSVEYHYRLTKDELRSVIEEEVDFLHYIGHVADEGFECRDGMLDVREIDSVGADSFFLNACQSYEQGMAMIEGGAIGGVVTLREVINSGAVEVGKTMARLLNRGFPLRAALKLSQGESVIGEQYIVIGDGELAIAQSESGTPTYFKINRQGDQYRTEIKTYPTTQHGMGSLVIPHIGGDNENYLISGTIETFDLSDDELLALLAMEELPVIFNSKLLWSSQISLSEL